MELPNDPFMLLSYVNTQLRDNFDNLDDMCQSLGVDKGNIEDKLAGIGYEYIGALHQFK